MNLKKIKILGAIVVFLLCFPLHFLYDWLPNGLFAIIAPVNESIWEHMKLIFVSFALYGLIEYLIIRKKNIKVNNYLLQLFLVPICAILVYLVIYVPIYLLIGEYMVISLVLLALIVIFEEFLSYILLRHSEVKYQHIIGIIGIIVTLLMFGVLTYKPIKNVIFFDEPNQQYGINTYKK